MGFDTYASSAYTLSDTITATTDTSVTNEGTTMAGCCSHINTCAPQPSDVTINVTQIDIGDSVTAWRQEDVVPVANVATLTYTPVSAYNLIVFVNGVAQRNDEDYVLSGKTITFSGTLPSDELVVLCHYMSSEISGVPTGIEAAGAIIAWSSSLAIPAGWLECDGSAVSRTIYADLFAAVGVLYGVGDGVTTFNVPDFEQSFYDPSLGAMVTLKAIIKY